MPTFDLPDEHPTKHIDPGCPACQGQGFIWAPANDWPMCLCMHPATPWPRGRIVKAMAELLTYRWGRILFVNGGFAGTCGQWAHVTPETATVKPRSHLR